MSLFGELQRRKVFKVGVAYLVVAWLLIQVVATLAPQLQLPDWAPRLVTLLLFVGFPIALVLAWALDVTPDGVKLDAAPAGNIGMFAFAGVLVAAALAWYFLAPSAHEKIRGSEPLSGPGAAAESTEDLPERGSDPLDPPAAKSIAVLAFTDLSPGKDQEYFSDGISEEILNALFKVKGLEVAGRTSSFYFKGKNEDLRRIGEALDVAHILEGSVRKQGDKVRITAQLIRAANGFHLWSETYDGELSDVFELQENIARAIVDELKVVLQGDQRERLVPVATANTDAYAKFLQATAIFNRRERARFPNAIALLDEAVALDPSFARAHARLGAFHVLSPEYTGADPDASIAAARQHANRAIELNPGLAEPHTVLAYSHGMRREFLAEHEAYERALALEPGDVLTNFWHALWFVGAGYQAQGARRLDHLLTLDPMLPNGLNWRGWLYLFKGDTANARRVIERALDLGLQTAHLTMSFIAHAEGDNARAMHEMQLGMAAFGAGLPSEFPRIMAEGAFGDDRARLRAVEHIETFLASRIAVVPGPIPYALMVLAEPARALEVIQSGPTSSSIWELSLWHPRGLAARRLPQFAEFARRVGYAEQWDVHGPPDGCRKAAGGDYACD